LFVALLNISVTEDGQVFQGTILASTLHSIGHFSLHYVTSRKLLYVEDGKGYSKISE
jgi:hypothetical protein